jgi:hypothetical protein
MFKKFIAIFLASCFFVFFLLIGDGTSKEKIEERWGNNRH